ncbi:hypothetical protein RugamoR1_12120 [Rugamonas sp. R1(2021)]
MSLAQVLSQNLCNNIGIPMRGLLLSSLLTVSLIGGYFCLRNEEAQEKLSIATTPLPAQAPKLPRAVSPWSNSPFSKGASLPPDQTEITKKRRARMAADGILTPEKYFSMSLKELNALGKAGDTLASLQLAERYWNDPAVLVYDPEMDTSKNPREIALEFYIRAVRGGAGKITAVIAKRMVDDGNLVEGAAWDMLAQRFGQDKNEETFTRNLTFSKLTYAQLGEAQKRAAEIASNIGFPIVTE